MHKKQFYKPQVKNTTMEIVNLFDNNFVQSWKKIPKCGICNQEFTLSRKLIFQFNFFFME